jgi:F0F1-type ATP synthase alpha subunit
MGGFISDCGNYGVFKFEKQWMVVFHNQQLEVFNTINQCKKFIKTHSASLETVITKPKTTSKPDKVKPSSRRTKCSQQK